jgi:hypothetical protein
LAVQTILSSLVLFLSMTVFAASTMFFCRTVVLFQTEGFHPFVILLKIQYVIDIGTSKGVNTLRIVSTTHIF